MLGHDEPVTAAARLPGSALLRWLEQAVGGQVRSVLFRSGHLSNVVGLELRDGRGVVLKVRPWQSRLLGCAEVHRTLMAAGFVCPALWAGPELVDGSAVSIEQFRPGGYLLPPAVHADRYARLLAELVRRASTVEQMADLVGDSPPWVGWDHPNDDLWPERDDTGRDLNRVPGPAWIDDAAQAARSLLQSAGLPLVVGHADFEAHNIDWRGDAAYAVHDWDSVAVQPEAAIAGAAAAVYTDDGMDEGAATLSSAGLQGACYARPRS